jgi:hypothetical protein
VTDYVLVGGRYAKFFVYEWNWHFLGLMGDERCKAMSSIITMQQAITILSFTMKTVQQPMSSLSSERIRLAPGRSVLFRQRNPSILNTAVIHIGMRGPTYAVVMASDNTEFIYTWDDLFYNFSRFNTALAIADGIPVVLNGSTVLLSAPDASNDPAEYPVTGGYAFRYDGLSWIPSGYLNYSGQSTSIRNLFSLGEDFIYRPFTFTSPNIDYKSYIKRFDANTRSWAPDIEYSRINNNYWSIAGYNFFLCNGSLFTRNTDATFSGPMSTNFINTDGFHASAGLDFIAGTLQGSQVSVVLMKNGQITANPILDVVNAHLPQGSTWSERIYEIIGSVRRH